MRINAIAPPPTKELHALKKACEQFEAIFAKQLLSEMRKGTQESPIGDQAGSAIYKDMMDQAIGDSIAHQGALGIGQMLYKQFAKQVAAKSLATSPASTDPSIQQTAIGNRELGFKNQPSADNPKSAIRNPKCEEDK